jgi:hypothetical protein
MNTFCVFLFVVLKIPLLVFVYCFMFSCNIILSFSFFIFFGKRFLGVFE